jgi:uncharacterized protein YjbI with pentapeptide repeats
MSNPSQLRDRTRRSYIGAHLKNHDFSGQDLQEVSFAGADLRNANFRDAKIQGASFHNADLCGANFTHASTGSDNSLPNTDFSHSKIKGAIFNHADLNHANFTGAKADLTLFWSSLLYVGHAFLCLISAFTSTLSIGFLLYFSRASSEIPPFRSTAATGVFAAFSIIVFRTWLLNSPSPWPKIALYSVWAGIIIIAMIFVVTVVNYFISEEGSRRSSLATGALLLLGLFCVTQRDIFSPYERSMYTELRGFLHIPLVNDGGWISMVIASLIGAVFGCWFSRSAVTEGAEFNWLWKLYINIATYRGTLFKGADLTEAIFTSATLKGANFKGAIIKRARWGKVRCLEQARMGNSYLNYPEIRQLFLGRKLRERNFDDLNLEGISLEGLDLSGASFIGTNLRFSTFKGSNLTEAFLQQAKLDGADLSNTTLTGACVHDWTIDENTILDHVKCEYIHLEKLPGKMDGWRRYPPSPKSFRDGDFENHFRSDPSIMELLIRNEFTQEALATAFQQLLEGGYYKLHGFRMIGDDALVQIRVPRNTDKRKVENKFQQELDDANQELHPASGSSEQPELAQIIVEIFRTLGENKVGDTINNINGGYIQTNHGTYIQGNYMVNMGQDLPQAAAQIQELIEQLQKSGTAFDVAQQRIAKDVADQASDPTIKEKLIKWGQSLGEATISDVARGALTLAIRSAGIPLP